MGLADRFLNIGTIIDGVVTSNKNSVVGVSSATTFVTASTSPTCASTGKKTHLFAGTTTGGCTLSGIEIGSVRPKLALARVARKLGRDRRNEGCLGSLGPVRQTKAPERVSGTILFLTDSSSSCIANARLVISNKRATM